MEVYVRVKNGLGERIRKDLDLQNLTVPAQWLGVFGAIVHGTGSLRLLYLSFINNYLSGWFWESLFSSDGNLKALAFGIWKLISIVAHDLNRIILPFGAVIVEVPYLQFRFPELIKGLVYWEIFYNCYETTFGFAVFFFHPEFGLTAWSAICLIASWVAATLMFKSLPYLRRINESTSAAPKTVFYASMAGILLVIIMYYFPYMFDVGLWILVAASILYGCTSILYCCAWYRGHGVVASRVLGGSGIEPIALAFPDDDDAGFITL